MFGGSDRAAAGWDQGWAGRQPVPRARAGPQPPCRVRVGAAQTGTAVKAHWLSQAVNPWPDHRAELPSFSLLLADHPGPGLGAGDGIPQPSLLSGGPQTQPVPGWCGKGQAKLSPEGPCVWAGCRAPVSKLCPDRPWGGPGPCPILPGLPLCFRFL